MKKTLLAIALASATLVATASPLLPYAQAADQITLSNDYDRKSGYYQNEVKLTAAFNTHLGTFDGALLGYRFDGDSATGFELGWATRYTFKHYDLKGRIAYGRLNNVDMNGGGFEDSADYGTISLELSRPLSTRTNGFIGFKHRADIGQDDIDSFNKIYAGVDVALNKTYTLRVAGTHTRQGGQNLNGIYTSISYNF